MTRIPGRVYKALQEGFFVVEMRDLRKRPILGPQWLKTDADTVTWLCWKETIAGFDQWYAINEVRGYDVRTCVDPGEGWQEQSGYYIVPNNSYLTWLCCAECGRVSFNDFLCLDCRDNDQQ